MAVNIIMPKWGHTMETGKIVRWLKNEGDLVEKGDELFEVETEKITNRVEATAGGILYQILVPEGYTVPVGTVVAILAEAGEEPGRIEAFEAAKAALDTNDSSRPAPVAVAAPKERPFVRATPAARRLAKELGLMIDEIPGTGADGRVTEKDVARYESKQSQRPQITPLAAEMARQAGLELSTLTGTGDGGKIVAEDVERILIQEREAQPVGSIPFTGMRRTIAHNMHSSLMNTAQLTAFTEADVTESLKFRDLVRKETQKEKAVDVSLNDIFILATSRALKRFPIMNSTLIKDEILLHEAVNMGMAVALSDGLMVPVLRNADKKGLLQISEDASDLIRKTREGSLSVDDVTGGTFTITNLGMFGIDGITPILRPPETGILGFGRIRSKPAVHNGEIAIRSMMTVSLTFDHRVVDGAPASRFLQTVARFLEEPALILR